ncbi:MAG: hypothetical protein ACTHM2_16345 [Afipia sp.]
MTVRSRRQTLGQIFAAPMVIGALSVVGLISALVGDGVWDGLSWLTLGVPVVLCAYFTLRPRS